MDSSDPPPPDANPAPAATAAVADRSAVPHGESLVEVQGLTRRFGRRTALHEVDLDVRRGEILALVGPNGCGKTTLMRIMAGFVRPSRGQVRVFGHEPFSHRAEVMAKARFAFAPPPLYESMNAREHLHALGGLGGRRPDRRAVDECLALVGLAGRERDLVRTYSFGMRQRLALVLALMPTPELLVLDEPNEGLDPLAVLELRAILKELHERLGLTLVLSSHLLTEVDQLVDRMLVLQDGLPLFLGTPEELRGDAAQTFTEVDQPAAARRFLEARGLPVHVRGNELSWSSADLDLESLREGLRAEGVVLQSFHRRRPSLEEALLELLRGARRDAP